MATDRNDQATAAMPLPGAGARMFMAPVAGIVASLTNPRKTFDQAKLRELADSIAPSGVHQPILVRPLPASRVEETSRAKGAVPVWPFATTRKAEPIEYELVAGERRWRACQLAGVAEIPVMARELSDEQVLEIQIVENLQREDVSPLEEAEGYGALMRQGSGMDADAVASKIGKSRSYVYARLKLLDLCQTVREALATGEIDNSRALRIARIPVEKAQITALKEASRRSHRGDFAMGVREFEGWLQRNVMLKLEDAPFPIKVVGLVPGVGACGDCPKRTGAEPELFADVDSPDLCTDPACHAAKAHAHAEALRAAAEAKGMRIIEGKEAKEIVRQHSYDGYGRILQGYTRLEATRADLAQDGKRVPLRELLGDKGPKPVLIEDPYSKELIEAVPTDEAEAVLVRRGAIKTTKKIDLDEEVEFLTRKSEQTQKKATNKARRAAIMRAIHAHTTPAKVLTDAELLREWLKLEIDFADEEDMPAILSLPPVEDEDREEMKQRAVARIDRADAAEVRRYMLALMLIRSFWQYSGDNWEPTLRAATRALGVDMDAVDAEATAAEKAELAQAIANLRAAAAAQDEADKPAAPDGTSTPPPAAQASPTRAKAKKSTAPAALARDAARVKTTAAEAQAQIAAELRALEDANQAPAAQGDDAAAVAGAQPQAAPHGGAAGGAQATEQAPAAQGDEAPPAARALAAASAAPQASATRLVPGGFAMVSMKHANKRFAGHLVRLEKCIPGNGGTHWICYRTDGKEGVFGPAEDMLTPCPAPSSQASAGVGTGAAEEVGIGTRVRINETATGKQQKPWIGYEGNVVAQIGDAAWCVAIERSKRCAPKQVVFDVTELEVVA